MAVPMYLYQHVLILEALFEGADDNLFMLLLNDAWSGGEYSERGGSHCRVWRLTGLEQSAQQLGPYLLVRRGHGLNGKGITVNILPRNLCNSIGDHPAGADVLFFEKGLKELGADGIPLWLLQAQEQL